MRIGEKRRQSIHISVIPAQAGMTGQNREGGKGGKTNVTAKPRGGVIWLIHGFSTIILTITIQISFISYTQNARADPTSAGFTTHCHNHLIVTHKPEIRSAMLGFIVRADGDEERRTRS
jgi:hypothetical protein